jgi:hypothetical protein
VSGPVRRPMPQARGSPSHNQATAGVEGVILPCTESNRAKLLRPGSHRPLYSLCVVCRTRSRFTRVCSRSRAPAEV